MTPSLTEVAWFAGLLDGEGCVTIRVLEPTQHHRRPHCQLFLSISMTHFLTIKKVYQLWNVGSVSETSTTSGKPYWEWKVTANKALLILEAAFPFLVTKKAEAEIAIAFQRQRIVNNKAWGTRNRPISCLEQDNKFAVLLRETRGHG